MTIRHKDWKMGVFLHGIKGARKGSVKARSEAKPGGRV